MTEQIGQFGRGMASKTRSYLTNQRDGHNTNIFISGSKDIHTKILNH